MKNPAIERCISIGTRGESSPPTTQKKLSRVWVAATALALDGVGVGAPPDTEASGEDDGAT